MGRASLTRIGCWLQKVSAQILTVGLSSSFLRSHPPGPPDEGGPSNLHVLIFGGKEDYWQNRPGCLVSHGGRVLQVGANYLLLSEEAARRHLCRNSAPSERTKPYLKPSVRFLTRTPLLETLQRTRFSWLFSKPNKVLVEDLIGTSQPRQTTLGLNKARCGVDGLSS